MTGWTLPLQMGVNVDAVTDPLGADERALLTKIDKAELPAQGVDGTGTCLCPEPSHQCVV